MDARRVVIIAGAGASRTLGAKGQPLPLMPDWAASLVGDLGNLAAAIGLSADMPGEEFETRLGRLLAFQKALPVVDALGNLGTPGSDATARDGSYQSWLQIATRRADDIIEGLRRNLYENFGLIRVDSALAADAYANFHKQLHEAAPGESRVQIAYATTNYDSAIEVAVGADDGLELWDGFTSGPGGRTETLKLDGMADRWERANTVPVLHLHGAVGWYYRQDGTIKRQGADEPYNSTLGQPALLLPDDQKTVNSFLGDGLKVWEQFNALLDSATHVMFLGHGLNDRHIVDAIKAAVSRRSPAKRPALAVQTFLEPDTNGTFPEMPEGVINYIQERLNGAHVIPGRMAPGFYPLVDHSRLAGWLSANT